MNKIFFAKKHLILKNVHGKLEIAEIWAASSGG